jgi:hypothetical protein
VSPHRDKEATRLRAETEDALRGSGQQLAQVRRRLARALAGRQQLEARRALDVEGFVADITLLRRALTATDRFVPGQCDRQAAASVDLARACSEHDLHRINNTSWTPGKAEIT